MEETTAASPAPLERSVSQQSATSTRSHRSIAVRSRKRLTSQPSSSASSIAASASDKSLTSFPSFSPESPRDERAFLESTNGSDSALALASRDPSGSSSVSAIAQEFQERQRPASIVDDLTTTAPPTSRGALFEDAPLSTRKIPGALHHAPDEHIERLIARHGVVNLVRQVAEDLAERDTQISALRRRADERERALRKIILECGLSNLDLETRLRAIEQEAKTNGAARRKTGDGLSDLMNDAMSDNVRDSFGNALNDATIRASGGMSLPPVAPDGDTAKGTMRAWKEYLWGGTTRKLSRASSNASGSAIRTQPVVIRAGPTADRRPTLADDLFSPPETDSVRSSSRASSTHSAHAARKPSLASMALRLVAGGGTVREGEPRGRADSPLPGGSLRTSSVSSAQTSVSTRAVSAQGGPKALMAMRRATGGIVRPIDVAPRMQPQERWDTMVPSPGKRSMSRQESYGPVEMDRILPAEVQPPTLTHIYNNYNGAEYLTDRFGFIYDQRRKKRQREAAKMARHVKKGSRTEMLTNGRGSLSPVLMEGSPGGKWEVIGDGRPDTPSSLEELRDDVKPKRWQDYLKIATFPTELLSHTPSISVQGFEVMEGYESPKSPGLIISEERGFLPSATTTAAIAPIDNDSQSTSENEESSATLAKDDAEPVRLLLENLSQLHDTLQRDKTVRWNDFLRKVRAERKRDGEAAVAAVANTAEARLLRATAMMPETRLGDGELIGVASLGIQGKVGRVKANEFKALILAGVPVAYRAKIWSECSGARALRIPGYYEDIVNRPEDQDDPQVVLQIKADITRTLTDNIFFRKGPGVEKLNEVLLAYARRNLEIGYCQGMNLVAANLLLVTPTAEDAFWILVSIVEQILPPSYFDHSLLASRADQQVLRQYVAQVLPKLSQHFEDLSIDLETMTFQWFLSVFTDCLSAEALFRVWDVVLCTNDGSTFLFQVALALLKLNEQQLLACDSPASIYTYINHQMTNHAISIDGLIQASEGLRRLVKREEVEARREKAIEGEREQARLREERLANRRLMHKAASAPAVVSEENVITSASASESGGDLQDPPSPVSVPLPIDELLAAGLGGGGVVA
ncbi:rab-GTPase-TBC domain-containing protein [Lasiosphaeria miniovina]|uniref:Rab-GTPase-TBC domain-containing protein n=1 Tax=Lasiosphaeria miniovina TaxID=1954250 RepID=A0AA40DMT9_9PEZI|nr:rab-GTPase-TBC domain-containing protein [Lasiosphaeria miniovina]KAK0706986.1 rab-GTPase-TBC domain-containing protein [Lasiosphaeria miniovina]